jgi:hypothetical protein
MAARKEPVSTPLVLITTVDDGRATTKAYAFDRLPPIVIANVRVLVDERCWMEVAYGDAVDDARRYVDRLSALTKAEVKGLDLRTLPPQYLVVAYASYDSSTPTSRILRRSRSTDPKVVKVTVHAEEGASPPRVEYYLLDRLPAIVVKRLYERGAYLATEGGATQAAQHSQPSQEASPSQRVHYCTVFYDDLNPSGDYPTPDQQVAISEREREIGAALATGDPAGYDVVLERTYRG